LSGKKERGEETPSSARLGPATAEEAQRREWRRDEDVEAAKAAAAVPESFLERLEASLRETSLCIVPLDRKCVSFESRISIQRVQSHFTVQVLVFFRVLILGTTEIKV